MSANTDKIMQLAGQIAAELEKFETKGNDSAAKRARKLLQELKNVCTNERTRIQAKRTNAPADEIDAA